MAKKNRKKKGKNKAKTPTKATPTKQQDVAAEADQTTAGAEQIDADIAAEDANIIADAAAATDKEEGAAVEDDEVEDEKVSEDTTEADDAEQRPAAQDVSSQKQQPSFEEKDDDDATAKDENAAAVAPNTEPETNDTPADTPADTTAATDKEIAASSSEAQPESKVPDQQPEQPEQPKQQDESAAARDFNLGPSLTSNSTGTDPDLEPTLTVSFGSDEFNNANTNKNASSAAAPYSSAQPNSNDINLEVSEASSEAESESTSQVMSDFTLGNFSTTSNDSAIAALASLSARGSTTQRAAVAAAAAAVVAGGAGPGSVGDGKISPLPMTRGISSKEEAEDTKALPPLDTSIDYSPEISLAGDDNDDEENKNGEEQVSDEAEEELDREIGISLGAVAGEPSPRHEISSSSLHKVTTAGSTKVEVGAGNDGEKAGVVEDDEEQVSGKAATAATATAAAALATAGMADNSSPGIAAGATAATAGDEGGAMPLDGGAPASIADDPENIDQEEAPHSASPTRSAGSDGGVTNEEEDVAVVDEGCPRESEQDAVNADGEEEANPFASYGSTDDQEKEWVASVLAVGTVGGVAAGTAADAMGNVEAETGVPASDSAAQIGEKRGGGSEAIAADASVDNTSATGTKGETPVDANQARSEEDDDDNSGDGTKKGAAVATGVVGAAALGAAVGAAATKATPSEAGHSPTDMPAEAEAVYATATPDADIVESSGAEKASREDNTLQPNESDKSFDGVPGKDSSDSSFYQHGTFSEGEDSSSGSSKEEGGGKLVAAVAAAGAVASGEQDAAPLPATPDQVDDATQPSAEKLEFTVVASGIVPLSLDEKDGEAPQSASPTRSAGSTSSPAAASFAGTASPSRSPGSVASHTSKRAANDMKKKRMIIAAGALVFVAGVVGIALALTVGRKDQQDKGAPVIPDVTPSPISGSLMPTSAPPVVSQPPTNLPVPAFPIPTTAPIAAKTSSPTANLDTNQPITSLPTSLRPTVSLSSQPTALPTIFLSPTQAPLVPTAAPVATAAPTSRATGPTTAPTSLAYTETLVILNNYLGTVVPDPTTLEDPTSPQYSAMTWLASDLAAKSRRLQQNEATKINQRYSLATLYFSTGGDSWTNAVDVDDDGAWLSPSNECSWSGVICSPLIKPRIRDSTPYKGAARPQRANPSLRGRKVQEEEQGSKTNNDEELLNEGTASATTSVPTNQATTIPPMTDATSSEPTPDPTTSPQEAQLVVSGLELDDRNMNGPIPPDIILLPRLKFLAASNNGITSIPSEIRELRDMERIYLNNNAVEGEIPKQLGRLSKLVDLGLHSNKFEGTIPSLLGNLASLVSLELHNNDLTGTMPEYICVLRYVGEDDILAHLTADCASSGNAPPKIECENGCCTECYPLYKASDATAAPTRASDPPTTSGTSSVADGALTEPPDDTITTDPPTASSSVASDNAAAEPLARDTIDPPVDAVIPPVVAKMDAPEPASDPTAGATTTTTTTTTTTGKRPTQSPTKASSEVVTDVVRTEDTTNARGRGDSNDWYLYFLEDQQHREGTLSNASEDGD